MKNQFFNITERQTDEIIAKATAMKEPSAAGGQSFVYLVGDFAVLKPRRAHENDMGFWMERMEMDERVIELLEKLKSRGIHVYPISAIKDDYIIEPRASGAELYDYRHIKENKYVMKRTKTLADAPQTHFDGFVSDYKSIIDSRIHVDSNSPMNFFYDKRDGFSFIDLNRMLDERDYEYRNGKLAEECFLPVHKSFYTQMNYYGFPTLNRTQFNELQGANTEIFQKCTTALVSNGVSTAEKLKTFAPRVNSITYRDYQKYNGQKSIGGADLDFY